MTLLRTSSILPRTELPILLRSSSIWTPLLRNHIPTPPRPPSIGTRQISYSHTNPIKMATQGSAPAWKPSKPRGAQRESDHKTGAKGEPMRPLPSATLVVLCPRSAKKEKAGGELQYDTVMLQRSARDGSSFRSAVVFPGGALDLIDQAEINAALPQGDEMEKYMHALKLCALRETFEEAGLLLLPSSNASPSGLPTSRAVGHQEAGMSAQEWAHARNDVHHNAVDFVPFLRNVCSKLGLNGKLGAGENALPELTPMAHYSNWVTPRSVVRPAKRFDTHFFITVLDTPDVFGSDKSLHISADGSETLSLRLQTPSEIMFAGITDQISLFPPQFYVSLYTHPSIPAPFIAFLLTHLSLIHPSSRSQHRSLPT